MFTRYETAVHFGDVVTGGSTPCSPEGAGQCAVPERQSARLLFSVVFNGNLDASMARNEILKRGLCSDAHPRRVRDAQHELHEGCGPP